MGSLAYSEDGQLHSWCRCSSARMPGKQPPLLGVPALRHHSGTRSALRCCREPGWAGVAVAPGAPAQAAVARAFARDVTLFDAGMPVRTLHTMHCPTAVQLLSASLAASPQGGPLVAVTEGPQLSIWDVRGAGRGARVARLSPGPHHGRLLCLAASDNAGLPLIGEKGPLWADSNSSCTPACNRPVPQRVVDSGVGCPARPSPSSPRTCRSHAPWRIAATRHHSMPARVMLAAACPPPRRGLQWGAWAKRPH